LLFAKDHAKSFEEAVDVCIESLRKQILKHKEKLAV
jgi:putative sigma-54 modulation protein